MKRAIVFIGFTILCAIGELFGLYEMHGVLRWVSMIFYIPVFMLCIIGFTVGVAYVLKPVYLKIVDFLLEEIILKDK